MCGLCSDDKKEREMEVKNTVWQAKQLRQLALHLDGLASGSIKPHSKETKIISVTARSILRFIVEDWI